MMAWKIEVDRKAAKILKSLDARTQAKIKRFLDALCEHPMPRAAGEPLYGEYKGLWRYRVGDYRLVCKLEDHALRILIVRVGHRRDVYRG